MHQRGREMLSSSYSTSGWTMVHMAYYSPFLVWIWWPPPRPMQGALKYAAKNAEKKQMKLLKRKTETKDLQFMPPFPPKKSLLLYLTRRRSSQYQDQLGLTRLKEDGGWSRAGRPSFSVQTGGGGEGNGGKKEGVKKGRKFSCSPTLVQYNLDFANLDFVMYVVHISTSTSPQPYAVNLNLTFVFWCWPFRKFRLHCTVLVVPPLLPSLPSLSRFHSEQFGVSPWGGGDRGGGVGHRESFSQFGRQRIPCHATPIASFSSSCAKGGLLSS